jgi:hypothetical protein
LLVFALFSAGLIVGRPWSEALGGLAMLSFALAAATNWRGLLDALHGRYASGSRSLFSPFAGTQGRDVLRATFALAAGIGGLVFLIPLIRLVA